MRVIILPDSAAMSHRAAETVINRINAASNRDRPFVLGLPTGATPIGMYDELVRAYNSRRLSFRHVATFNMDEYVGLPPTHPLSYHAFMHRHLFSLVDILPENIHILDGCAPDLDRECADYETAIRQAGGIDLFVGGMGGDGHVAFNEPFSSLASRTRRKTLTADTRQANSRFFFGDPNRVPHEALTVGVQTIMDAREVMILAAGQNKARALRDTIEGPVAARCPLSALQFHPRLTIIADAQAATLLKPDTYQYFKDIEQ